MKNKKMKRTTGMGCTFSFYKSSAQDQDGCARVEAVGALVANTAPETPGGIKKIKTRKL